MGLALQLVSFVTANAAIIMLIIGVSTDHWASRENSRRHTHEGLWKKCVNHKVLNLRICMKPYRGDVPGKLIATILMLALTAIVHFFTFFLSIFLLCTRKKFLEGYEKGYAFTLLVSLLSTFIGIIIYTTYYNGNYYKLNWSYALCWGGIISYFAAFIMQVIHVDQKGKEEAKNHVKYNTRRV